MNDGQIQEEYDRHYRLQSSVARTEAGKRAIQESLDTIMGRIHNRTFVSGKLQPKAD